LANDYVDNLLELVRSYVVDNGLSEIEIPDIQQGFEQDVSQAHNKIAEENKHLLYSIR